MKTNIQPNQLPSSFGQFLFAVGIMSISQFQTVTDENVISIPSALLPHSYAHISLLKV